MIAEAISTFPRSRGEETTDDQDRHDKKKSYFDIYIIEIMHRTKRPRLNRHIQVFDFLNDKRLIGSLLGLSAGVISLAFGPRGRQLAVGLANGQVRVCRCCIYLSGPPCG